MSFLIPELLLTDFHYLSFLSLSLCTMCLPIILCKILKIVVLLVLLLFLLTFYVVPVFSVSLFSGVITVYLLILCLCSPYIQEHKQNKNSVHAKDV
jgi:hypothetical protein